MSTTFKQQIYKLKADVVDVWINQLNKQFNWHITLEQSSTSSKTNDNDNARKALYNALSKHQIKTLSIKGATVQIAANGKVSHNGKKYKALDLIIQRIEQQIYKRIKKRLNNEVEFTFELKHFKEFKKNDIVDWIDRLNQEFNWNIQYQQDNNALSLHRNMKTALIQALNDHRVNDNVYEFMNQSNVIYNNRVRNNLIDVIVNSIKLFKRYQQKEQEQRKRVDDEYFKQFNRDDYKIDYEIDNLHHETIKSKLARQLKLEQQLEQEQLEREQLEQQRKRDIENNIRIAREALDNAINLIKNNQHAIFEKQRKLERVNNNPELYEYLEHHSGKIDKSNYDGDILEVNEPQNQEDALDKLNKHHAKKDKEKTSHKVDKKPIEVYYFNNIRSLNHIYDCLQEVYDTEQKPFKLHFQLGGVFETRIHDFDKDEYIYKYEYREIKWNHFRESIPIIIRDENNIDEVKLYIESVLHNYETTSSNTKLIYVSNVSFTVSRLQKVSGYIAKLPKIFINNHYIITDNIDDNLCWYRFLATCIYQMANKQYKPIDRTNKAKKLLLEEHGIIYNTKIPKNGIELLQNYQGSNIEQMQESAKKHNINVDLYLFDEPNNAFELLEQWRFDKSYNTYSALIYSNKDALHIMYIVDSEKLTNIHICSKCHMFIHYGNHNIKRFHKHVEKCKGEFVKKYCPNYQALPYCPHILENHVYEYCLAHNIEWKPTIYYITYEFNATHNSTNEQITLKSISSCAKCECGVVKQSFDNVISWIEWLFEQSRIIYQDKLKYFAQNTDSTVHVLGFGSSKFESNLFKQYLNTDKWHIEQTSIIGTLTSLKQVVLVSRDYQTKLKFIDAQAYTTDSTLTEFLTNSNSNSLNEAIDKLIALNAEYHVDLLHNLSLSKNASCIKYAMAYEQFENDFKQGKLVKTSNTYYAAFKPNRKWWSNKCSNYYYQDSKYNNSHPNNLRNLDKCVCENDYDKFIKKYNKSKCCYLCGEMFTNKNKPTLDRVDNNIGHEFDNCELACAECNKLRSREDANITRLRIQLKNYCKLHNLPTLITDENEYRSLRDNIVGGLSNVMHRVNVSGETHINKLYYEQNKVISRNTNNIVSKIIGLDFNSLYPSVFSSKQHEFNRYHGGIMYMPGSLICRYTDKNKCMNIITSTSRFANKPNYVFKAEVKLKCPKNKINYFINFPPIFRHITIKNDEQTLGKYMYEYMNKNSCITIDKDSDILTQLIDTNNEYMTFNNYYLWFLLDHGLELVDVQSVSMYSCHKGFNNFVETFFDKRINSKSNQQFYKIMLNGSFGYDGINSERYMNLKICDENKTRAAIFAQNYVNGVELNNNNYIIQSIPKSYRCKTPLQEAFWTLDNAKFWYLTFYYDFIDKCYDRDKFHFINMDTDSLYIAVSDDYIKDKAFYNKNVDKFMSGNKQLLGLSIEREGSSMIALAPKCYSIISQSATSNGISKNSEINKLKGLNLTDNDIHYDDYKEIIDKNSTKSGVNKMIKCKGCDLFEIEQEKRCLTGYHNKMVVLSNQCCAPFVYGLKASDYSIQ